MGTASKKRIRSNNDDGEPAGEESEGKVITSMPRRSAFAPAQVARQAAAVVRAAKKAQVIKVASKKRNATMTTTNLSDRERFKIFVMEKQQVQSVANHAAFQADPIGAIERHLAATADRLQPQTADVGRKHVVKADPNRGLATRQQQHLEAKQRRQ